VNETSTVAKVFERGHSFLRANWQRLLGIRERIRFSEEAFHLVLAGGVGVVGGLVNLVFYYGIESTKRLVFHRAGDPVEIAEVLARQDGYSRLLVVLIPTLGGIAAGLILYWGLRLIPQKGPTNMLEVVVAGDGKLPLRSAVIKALSSLVSIGTGASLGREGAISQLTATFASKWGQIAGWHPYRLRMLVGCGAASGIAAAYNAPISGAVFASLIVLGNFSMNLFAPLVFASVVSTMVSRSFFGIKPWYSVPSFDLTSILQLPWFLLLGIFCGVLGALFLIFLDGCEKLFRKSNLPIYVRLAIGGFIVGIIAIWFPGVWGNGFAITNRILQEQFDVQFPLLMLTGLFFAKLLATGTTIGSGAVGGVFTPTLFLGAGLGGIFGLSLHELGQAKELPTAAFALVGMGSVLAATTHSPLLAMILVFEISLNYSLMPPLMLGCVVSILVAQRIHKDSIHTAPLRLKGLALERETAELGAATERTVGDLMRSPVPPLRETSSLAEIGDRFLTSSNNFLPVVDAQGQLVGVVSLHDLKEYLKGGQEIGVIAYDVMRPSPPCVTPNQRLLDVLPVVLASEQRNVPVVNSLKENRLVGSLERAEVLGVFSEAISAGGKREDGR
jgi:chloride channel protein, CIC family